MERSQWQPMNTYSMNSIHALNQQRKQPNTRNNINPQQQQHANNTFQRFNAPHGSFQSTATKDMNTNMNMNSAAHHQNQNQNGMYRTLYGSNSSSGTMHSQSQNGVGGSHFPPYGNAHANAQMKPPSFTLRRDNSNNINSAFLVAVSSVVQHHFREFPIVLQSFLTAVIAFVAYFFYDYASGVSTWRSYLLYRVVSLLLFLGSVLCLYAVYQNLTSSSSSASAMASPPAVPPPPSSSQMQMRHPLSTNQNLTNVHRQSASSASSSSLTHAAAATHKRDDLYFTKKELHRASSSSSASFSSEPKYDFNSSPTKIASYDPTQIVNQAQLNSLFARQQQHPSQASYARVPLTPSAANTPITSMLHANANARTPIGKTFGSMRMTPAVPHTKVAYGNTNANQFQSHAMMAESVNLYTPISSNMDVTMLSFDKDSGGGGDSDPFSNLDYSAIQPTPLAPKTKTAMAWNVSGFGAGGAAAAATHHHRQLTDLSTLAQPGTPAKHDGYDYGGMYTDINLRGDRITAVAAQPTFTAATQSSLAAAASAAGESGAKLSRVPPASPFARAHERRSRLDAAAAQQQSLVNPVVFTTMGLAKSQFAASYMEKSIKLYKTLQIDGLIENWAESMRWWLAERLKTRCHDLWTSNADIERIFMLLQQKYNIQSQLASFKTASQKESFVLANEQQLINVAREARNASIVHIVQKRKHLKECVEFVIEPHKALHAGDANAVTEYVYTRLQTLASSTNLNSYAWNGGDSQLFAAQKFPNDANLVMALFCKYMDDAMCPAIQFSLRHYVEVSLADMHKVYRLHKRFKDVAIVCVSDSPYLRQTGVTMTGTTTTTAAAAHMNIMGGASMKQDLTAQDSLPYFFIAYNKKKFEGVIQSLATSGVRKPKHFLQNAWDYFGSAANSVNGNGTMKTVAEEKATEESDDEYGHGHTQHQQQQHKRHSKHGDAVGTWYPQPGKNNLLHTITLFALFLHKCCNDKLADIALKDQGCTLLEPLLK